MLIADIRRAVARHYGMTPAELMTDSRERRYARPRQVAMYLAWERQRWSLAQIARRFDRDRKTVWHGVKQIEHLARRPDFCADLATIRERLG